MAGITYLLVGRTGVTVPHNEHDRPRYTDVYGGLSPVGPTLRLRLMHPNVWMVPIYARRQRVQLER